jgi:hypothetical protein
MAAMFPAAWLGDAWMLALAGCIFTVGSTALSLRIRCREFGRRSGFVATARAKNDAGPVLFP